VCCGATSRAKQWVVLAQDTTRCGICGWFRVPPSSTPGRPPPSEPFWQASSSQLWPCYYDFILTLMSSFNESSSYGHHHPSHSYHDFPPNQTKQEAAKYNSSSRIIGIQSEITARAIELLALEVSVVVT